MNKKNKKQIELVIWDFINKHINLIFFFLVTILSFVIRIIMLKHTSGDYDMFLKPWFDELKSFGGLGGLAKNIGNYTPIYMTILAILTYLPIKSLISIKLVSILFDYLGGFIIILIVKELLNNKYKDKIALIIYSIYICLPTVFLNSSYWAQSDSIYTAFVLISLLYLLRKDFIKGILFWSIAFTFKFQAIFIFPLYVLIYISDRKIKLKYFLTIPVVVFLLSVPKICFSHNLLDGFRVYYNQSHTYSQYLTLNFPNFYSIFFVGSDPNSPNLIPSHLNAIGTIGIIITMIIFITIAFLVHFKKIKFDKKAIIEFGLWSVLIATFFLPQMHERYLFMADVIGLLYLVLNKDKFYIPVCIELISLNGYMYLLFSGFALNITYLSILNLVILLLYTKNMCDNYFKLV